MTSTCATEAGGASMTSCPSSTLQRPAPQSTPATDPACFSGARPTPEETSTEESEGKRSRTSTRLGVILRVSGGARRPSASKRAMSGRFCAPAGNQWRAVALVSAGSVFGTPHVHVSTPFAARRSRHASIATPVSLGHVMRTPCNPWPFPSRRPSSRARVKEDASNVGHAAVAMSFTTAGWRAHSATDGATWRSMTLPIAVSDTGGRTV